MTAGMCRSCADVEFIAPMRVGGPSRLLTTSTPAAPLACAWRTLSAKRQPPRSISASLPASDELIGEHPSTGVTATRGRGEPTKGSGTPKLAFEKTRSRASAAGLVMLSPSLATESSALSVKVDAVLPCTDAYTMQPPVVRAHSAIAASVCAMLTTSLPVAVVPFHVWCVALGRAWVCETKRSGLPEMGVRMRRRSVAASCTYTRKYSYSPAPTCSRHGMPSSRVTMPCAVEAASE
mmetsp:Transcript_32712/g.75470  ORF Transcript_32712/g.75470 Transcript_32712/m.75470 type:complete len:236 (-) Transcript_32712:115-822(-)